MPKLRLIVLLPFLLLATAPSFSQHMNERDSPCVNVVSTSDSAECLSKARVSSDEKLRIQYRDANCEAERALYVPGTGAGPAHLACLEAMTRERTKELRITYTVRLKD